LIFFITSWLALCFFRPRDMFRQKAVWALGWGCFVLWTLPMAYHYHLTPGEKMFWMSRMGQVNLFAYIKAAGNLTPLWTNMHRAFRMYNVWAGDTQVYGLANAPLLAPWEGLALLTGVAYCFWRAARPAFFLLFMGFFGSVFTVILSDDPTDATRAIAGAPFVFLLVGIGLDRLSRAASAPLGRRGGLVASLFLAGLVALSTGWHYDLYFRQLYKSRATWAFNYGDHLLAARTLSAYPSGWNFYMPYAYSEGGHEGLFLREFEKKNIVCFYPDRSLPFKDASPKGNVLLLPLGLGRDLQDQIHTYYPDSSPKTVFDPFGDPVYLLWEITPEQAKEALQAPRHLTPQGVRLAWYDSKNKKMGQWILPALFDDAYWFQPVPGRPPFPYSQTAYFTVDALLLDPEKRELQLETTGTVDWTLGGQKGHLSGSGASVSMNIQPASVGPLPLHIRYTLSGAFDLNLSIRSHEGWAPFPSGGLKP